MSEFLTTRQVQELIQVDRTTIYRMLKDGRLAGIKIGNQWRFSRSKIDDLLADMPPVQVNEPAMSFDVLPRTCLQGMQNVSAEAIGIGAVITDADGQPLTQMSNPCRFCQMIHSSRQGRAACQADWALSAQRAGTLLPQVTCHAGLQCVAAPIMINDQKTAVFTACQLNAAPLDSEKKHHIRQVAAAYGLDDGELAAAAGEIPVLTVDEQQKVIDWLSKLTGTLSEIGQERADLLGRLQRIAAMSTVG